MSGFVAPYSYTIYWYSSC